MKELQLHALWKHFDHCLWCVVMTEKSSRCVNFFIAAPVLKWHLGENKCREVVAKSSGPMRALRKVPQLSLKTPNHSATFSLACTIYQMSGIKSNRRGGFFKQQGGRSKSKDDPLVYPLAITLLNDNHWMGVGYTLVKLIGVQLIGKVLVQRGLVGFQFLYLIDLWIELNMPNARDENAEIVA